MADIDIDAVEVKIIDSEAGIKSSTVDKKDTTSIGVNTIPLGVYKETPPSLSNDQVFPLSLDSTGKLLTTITSPNRKTLTLSSTRDIDIETAGNYFNYLTYTVPSGYNLELTEFKTLSDDNRRTARVSKFISMGTFNPNTNVFTSGSSYTLPVFASAIEAEVTTVLGNEDDIILTATYTNQDGVTGRTATASKLKKNAIVGTKTLFVLQAGDYGVLEVTNISRNKANTGAIRINGLIELWCQRIKEPDTTYGDLLARESLIVNSGEAVALDFGANGGSDTTSTLKVVGILNPI